MADTSHIDTQISDLQARITALQSQRADILRAEAFADRNRPQGVPPTWLPIYDTTGVGYIITAWYDPSKWGNECNIVGKM